MRLSISVYLLALCLLVTGGGLAEARIFTPAGANQGLEAQVVSTVMVDSQGLLWIGSREGLYRYDGYEAEALLPEPGNAQTISDIDIRSIYEAKDGVIWIGTQTGGLNRYEPSSRQFSHFRHDARNPDSICNDSILSISEGPDGGLWVATRQGLSRLNRNSGTFENFCQDPADSAALSGEEIRTLHFSEEGKLWVGTAAGGVSLWDRESQDFISYDMAALSGGPAERNDVLSLLEDQEGRLWAGTREGLVKLDLENGQATLVDLGQLNGFSPVITAIRQEGSNRLWLSTMERGLLILDTGTGAWKEATRNPPGAAGGLPTDAVMSMAFGSGMVFVGTWGSGVYKAPVEDSEFRLLSMRNAEGLGNNVISAVMAGENQGQPWLGTFGGGPRLVNISENTVEAMPLKRHGMRASGVMSLAGPIDGWIYAATTHGLYEFSVDGYQVALYAHDAQSPGGIGEGDVTSLLAADGSGLWVGMGGSGLYYFETSGQRFSAFNHQADQPDSLSGDFITALLDDGKGHIWVGTRSNGLNLCRIKDWSCQRFAGGNGADGQLSHHQVTALFRDRRSRIWVGTDGGGLNQVLRNASGEVTGFRHWGRNDGLLANGVQAIQEDLDESLWLSTRQGLSRFHPGTGDVFNHVSASGLPVSYFNSNASAADQRFIYFGSTDGLLSIPKGTLLRKRDEVDVRVASVEHAVSGRPWRQASWSNGKLSLPYGEVIQVNLAVLDFAESKNEYAYRLDPGDPWVDLGPQRQINFHSLSPGRYELQARGRDAYGLWGESETYILEIAPPFWMTTWFRGLMVLVLVGLAGGAHLARQAVLRRRANEMLRLGATRERALEEKLGSEAELAVLTPRQKEILQLIAEGNSTREIAELLGVSIKTVEAHRANLMERLEIHDIPGLVRLAIRTRLVELQD